ncbi:hypothetical protein P280DRAFT_394527 [Massarina eburnea CBS 473.64]|uniref:RBR-type E3 ubiquitin transferase n=1 Tax=Massarina eburnea CBS 473.64 TaxID=1395130 RepID=A0A6A6S9X2_9PLEO|nr:hypothetical protein P280DRAFT_394527 [Massarina eburnea CBS 473.64]
MAPTTRLRAEPGRRVMYAPGAVDRESGTAHDPIFVADESPPPTVAAQNPYNTVRHAAAPIRNPTRITILKLKPRKVEPKKDAGETKAAAKPKTRKECAICATEKMASRSFKVPKEAYVCQHLQDTCTNCVGRMVKAMVTDRKLTEAVLACPFDFCECVLDVGAIMQIITPAAFKVWENALTSYILRTSETYIACLNPKCGEYFDIEECKPKARHQKKQAKCPNCEFAHCITCNRVWHPDMSCNANKGADEKKSEKVIKEISKPCPKCGVNIEKSTGCDHMTCKQCKHNFCWQCLVTFTSNMQHRVDCTHRILDIGNDMRNFVDDRTWHMNFIQRDPNMVNQFLANPPPLPPLVPALRRIPMFPPPLPPPQPALNMVNQNPVSSP